jgi:hypothetical protein
LLSISSATAETVSRRRLADLADRVGRGADRPEVAALPYPSGSIRSPGKFRSRVSAAIAEADDFAPVG